MNKTNIAKCIAHNISPNYKPYYPNNIYTDECIDTLAYYAKFAKLC